MTNWLRRLRSWVHREYFQHVSDEIHVYGQVWFGLHFTTRADAPASHCGYCRKKVRMGLDEPLASQAQKL